MYSQGLFLKTGFQLKRGHAAFSHPHRQGSTRKLSLCLGIPQPNAIITYLLPVEAREALGLGVCYPCGHVLLGTVLVY